MRADWQAPGFKPPDGHEGTPGRFAACRGAGTGRSLAETGLPPACRAPPLPFRERGLPDVTSAPRRRRLPPLAGLAEVADLASEAYGRPVSRKRAWQLTQHPAFPKPVQVLAMGPVWLEEDAKAFLAIERKPGRQRRD